MLHGGPDGKSQVDCKADVMISCTVLLFAAPRTSNNLTISVRMLSDLPDINVHRLLPTVSSIVGGEKETTGCSRNTNIMGSRQLKRVGYATPSEALIRDVREVPVEKPWTGLD